MNNADEFNGLNGLSKEDMSDSSIDLLVAADSVKGFLNESYRDSDSMAIIKNPILAIGIVLLSRLERMHFDFAETEHRKCSLLSDLIESIDCAGAKRIEHWMHSDIAAIDKAKELGVDILPEYSIADLRYKIDLAIREVL